MRIKCLEEISSAMYETTEKVFARDFFGFILRPQNKNLEPYIKKYRSKLVVDIEYGPDMNTYNSCKLYMDIGNDKFAFTEEFNTEDYVEFFNNLFSYLILGPPGIGPSRLDRRTLERIDKDFQQIGPDNLVEDGANRFYQHIVEKKLAPRETNLYTTLAIDELTYYLEKLPKLCLAFYHFFIAVFPDLFESRPYVFTKNLEQESLFHHYKKVNDKLFEEEKPIKNEIAGKLCYFIYHKAMDIEDAQSPKKKKLANALDDFLSKAIEISSSATNPKVSQKSMKAFL